MSYEEEDTWGGFHHIESVKEEDSYMSYEEEDT